ncbi:enoyl-CoA hydratase/isomerase family protein [Streptomyces sp. NPDC014646]|uniref:enoyl-CoA hydratase/isomerase family protein n=1 Tax=Streptomyces sp. NPDC014646 TaxID=3364877 RepID=UPI0036FC5293
MDRTEPRLTHTVADGVATVVIDNPAKRNAMTVSMWIALPPLLARLAADPSVRALVLTGAGDTFCAGADIASLRAVPPREPSPPGDPSSPGGPPSDPQPLTVVAEEALAAFPRPTLAAIRGYCVGGGSQLAAACDLRFAEEGAAFGVTPARLGIVYPASSTRRLVALAGPATAKHLLFSGELIDTARALRCGLVDEVLPAGGLDARVGAYTRTLAARSWITQAAAKEFADGRRDRDAYWAERVRHSGDTEEGVAAFLERRAPRFGPPEGAN